MLRPRFIALLHPRRRAPWAARPGDEDRAARDLRYAGRDRPTVERTRPASPDRDRRTA